MSKNEYDFFKKSDTERIRSEKKQMTKKKWIRCKEGMDLYSVSRPKLVRLAREEGAAYKLDGVILIDTEVLDRYLETFRIPGEML